MAADERRTPPIDPGLQPERTRLAWSRTSLTFFASGALMLHSGHSPTAWLYLVPGLTVMAAGALVYVFGTVRHRDAVRAARTGGPVAGGRSMAITAALACIAAVLGAVVQIARP